MQKGFIFKRILEYYINVISDSSKILLTKI